MFRVLAIQAYVAVSSFIDLARAVLASWAVRIVVEFAVLTRHVHTSAVELE